MSIILVAKLAGVLVTVGLLAALFGRVVQDAEWTRLFRVLQTFGETTDGHKRGFWSGYWRALETHARMLDMAVDRRVILVKLAGVTSGFFLIGLALHEVAPVALLVAIVLSLTLLRWHYARRAKRRAEDLTFSFLYEAVPVALHVLEASLRLDLAIARMAGLVRFAPMKQRLQELLAMTKQPQYESAEAAFFAWATELGISEITFFALATREAKRYGVSLSELWVDMRDILGKDLEYRRNMRHRTAHYRQGGYIFYGMLAGTLLLTYPFTQSHMASVTQVVFWIVLGVMTLGLYAIVRESQSIDV